MLQKKTDHLAEPFPGPRISEEKNVTTKGVGNQVNRKRSRQPSARLMLLIAVAIVATPAIWLDAEHVLGLMLSHVDAAFGALSRPWPNASSDSQTRAKFESIVVWVPGWAHDRFEKMGEGNELEHLVQSLELGPPPGRGSLESRDLYCIGVNVAQDDVELGFSAVYSNAERYLRARWGLQSPRFFVERIPEPHQSRKSTLDSSAEQELLAEELIDLVCKNKDQYRVASEKMKKSQPR